VAGREVDQAATVPLLLRSRRSSLQVELFSSFPARCRTL
jgi:hypothetical protein